MSAKGAPKALQLVKETAIDRGESEQMIFTHEQFSRFDQHFKRRLAGAADTDEITGRSTMLEIKSYLVCQHTLGEYTED